VHGGMLRVHGGMLRVHGGMLSVHRGMLRVHGASKVRVVSKVIVKASSKAARVGRIRVIARNRDAAGTAIRPVRRSSAGEAAIGVRAAVRCLPRMRVNSAPRSGS